VSFVNTSKWQVVNSYKNHYIKNNLSKYWEKRTLYIEKGIHQKSQCIFPKSHNVFPKATGKKYKGQLLFHFPSQKCNLLLLKLN
jgi:hypothetical protein